ncbi:MAG TPA: sialidase family protein [Puia sp.]|nr:sialidase family protein [Puia sp.]
MKYYRIYLIVIATALGACGEHRQPAEASEQPVLLSQTSRHASCVYLTRDEKNLPLVSWCEVDEQTKQKQFFLAYFNADSNRFSESLSVPIEQSTSIHEEGMPKIAVKGNGTLIAVYETAAPVPKNQWAGFVRYRYSTDRGKTWSAPEYLAADTSAGTDHSFASVTRLTDGEIGASWLDEGFDHKKPGRPVLFAKTNAENRFTREQLIDSVACECCRTAISCSANGRIRILFRNILYDSVRDMSVAVSDDNGKSFSKAISFSKDGWVMNGCPHNGPSVASLDNNTYAAWYTGGDKKGVYYAELSPDRQTLLKKEVSDRGRNIQLCVAPGGNRILAYSENNQQADSFYSRIMLNKVDDGRFYTKELTAMQGHAAYPVIQALNDRSVVVAWSENNKIYYSVVNTALIAKLL